MIRYVFYRFRYNIYIKSKIIVLISATAIVSVIIFFPHFITNTYRVTVTNKQVIKRNNINKYYIYTQTENGDIRVFENTDDFLEFKFNSADLYLSMEIDRRYEIKASGLNLPILSHYQNIIKVKVIDK